jgi:acetate kinase
MVILTINCGSSSLKYQLYDWDAHRVLATGVIERIGQNGANIEHATTGKNKFILEKPIHTHKEAFELLASTIVDPVHGAIADLNQIKAVGHRVLHGGEKVKQSVIITEEYKAIYKSIFDLGPLHMPANLMGVEAAQAVLPNVPHCAIMDTCWHQTMPDTSYIYALPYEWYKNYGVRRYGFHGTSFLYTAKRASVLLGKKPEDTNVIIAHIGNGSSICAVKDGKGFDTSMGLTPLEGLVMGTRSGDHDPAIDYFMMRKLGMKPDDMENLLNKKSGILGITGKFIDRRDVVKGAHEGDDICRLAMEIEAYRVKKYIGSYMAALGRVDAIVFTAGVGEMSPQVRGRCIKDLENLGIKLDWEKNLISATRNAETCISTDDSPIKVFVIPTDEELVMTEDTYALVNGTYDIHTKFKYSFQDPNYVNGERASRLQADLQKNPKLAAILVQKP